MLWAAVLFFTLALVSMILGTLGFAGLNVESGQSFLIIFLILAVISFVAGLVSRTSSKTENF